MYLVFFNLLALVCSIGAYKILVVYPFPVKSLSILGAGFTRHLLEAGHEVTFVTSYPTRNEKKNLRQIDISSNKALINSEEGFNIGSIMNNVVPMNDVKMLQEYALIAATATLGDKNFKDLLEDTSQTFDAVIIDLYESEIYSGISALYDCPLIWAYSMGAHWQPLRLIDEPTNPAYTADYLSSNVLPFTFRQRVEELWAQISWIWYKWYSSRLEDRLERYLRLHIPGVDQFDVARTNTIAKEKEAYEKFFGPLFKKRGMVLPEYTELIFNASLILANEHHTFGNIPKTPQNFKFVGGYHIEHPVKPLPENLQTLMDDSKHGVIYFSMGSTWSSKDFPRIIIEELLETFGELKQTVIWKFEEDLPNLPSNVKIFKWAPQQSILAHPNCLFFITHGGLLSLTEAIHFGVPIIGIPIFFDQFININKASSHGYTIRVPLNYEMPKYLGVAIQTMLIDPKYKKMAKELSAVYHDRPVPPGKEAVHWIEHVIRTKGAPHLRSPAFNVPFYQKMFLDLTAIIIASVVLLWCIIKRLFSKGKKLIKEKKN